MAKKKRESERKQRTDAERRARQAERLSCVLRVLRCIMGPGRWDAEALARELELSERTVHRILQTLSMAEVPWYYCKESECYRVRPGFRFPGIDTIAAGEGKADTGVTLAAARQLLEDGERFVRSLRKFCNLIEGDQSTGDKIT